MPNNRNRNRNRNRNKRNKNQNANQNKQQAAEETVTEEAAATAATSAAANDYQDDNNASSGNISNGSTTASDSVTAADAATTVIVSSESSQKEPEDQSAQVAKDKLKDTAEDQLEDLSESQAEEKTVDQLLKEEDHSKLDQPKDQSEVQKRELSVDQAKEQLIQQDLVQDQQNEQLIAVDLKDLKQKVLVDQAAKQSKELLLDHSEDRSKEQLSVQERSVRDQPEDLVEDLSKELPIATKEAYPKDLKKDLTAEKLADQLVHQSKQQLSKQSEQPVVHIVPVIVEGEEETKQQQSLDDSNTMGARNSKQQQPTELPQRQQETPQLAAKPPGSPRQAKVIVHRIVREDNAEVDAQQQPLPAAVQELLANCQQLQQEAAPRQHAAQQPLQRSTKVIIHQIRVETDAEERARKGKPQIEEISSTTTAHNNSNGNSNNSGTLSPPPRYLVESPSPKNVQQGSQFRKFAHEVKIQELELSSDCSSGEFNGHGALESPLVFEADSETEAPAVPAVSSPDMPSSSRAEQQEQLRLKRAQKRNALESHFLPQLLSPRYLDSILEENSEASAVGNDLASSLARSAEAAKTRPAVPPKANESFPRSQLDFSRRHKRREEQPALVLETKLLDQPADLESCTRLQSTLSPQSEDAELIYLSSSGSSSVSDLMELELEEAAALTERTLIDLDTDASKLINRPDDDRSSTTTMEPISSSNETETEGECEVETEVDTETEAAAAAATTEAAAASSQSSRESTPVNAHPAERTSAGSSLSSLLSAATSTPTPTSTPTATPTPAINELPREGNSTLLANEFGASQLANSSTATASLAATREEFVRNMEKVRELIEMTRREESANANGSGNVNVIGNGNGNGNASHVQAAPEQQQQPELRCRLSPTPPPVPPPPHSMHYYPTACTTDPPPPQAPPNAESHPILSPSLLKRQESNDSHCSDSTQHSQCTAIHMASPAPTTQQQQPPTPPPRQQQQAASAISQICPISAGETDAERIKKLRLLCTETLASMPYGEQMLEELASVAQNISAQQQQQQQHQQQQQQQQQKENMPYPLPHLPHISELQLSVDQVTAGEKEAWLGLPTQADPQLLVCLSPGQRALAQQQQLPPAADQLLDAHEKFVQRRGYHELSAEQVRAMDSVQLRAEQEQILKTAAKMRELRKSLTPTPTSTSTSPPPPPVPVKSAETAAKAKSQQQQADDASEHMSNSYQKPNTTATAAAAAATSSLENKPEQKTTAADQQMPHSFEQRTSSRTEQQHNSNSNSSSSYMSNISSKFPASMESELARMFPSIAQQGDIFDEQRKRFSNIEQSVQPKLSQQQQQQSKRYSNIETSSFESKKRIENGQVVYDYSNSSRERQQEGDAPTTNGKFPLQQQHVPATAATSTATATVDEVDCAPPVPPPPAGFDIMSATKLNGLSNTFNDDAQQQQQHSKRETTTTRTTTTTSSDSSAAKVNNGGTYEEFRQRAKAALAAIAQPDSNINGNSNSNSNTQPSANHLDNEKLFKDFDALSQQLNAELQTGREQRQQRDKSASLYDLSSSNNNNNNNSCQSQLEQLKRQRHAHMQELEREIERSSRARQERLSSVPRVLEIPIERETRRAESLCNLSEPAITRPHSSAEQYRAPQDDWSRYASDLGNSENIARPFAREVEICYQRQGGQRQPHAIRAPRLSASTNDLSTGYDSFNAYGGGRRHAPMLQQAPAQQRPHYASCYSMIERDPNPTYISTTSRRGVSPAPQPAQVQAGQPPAYDRQQRRASLPRELHEQQLQYILSKEEQLKLEFERLQLERRRLMEEMQRAPTVLQAPPPRRESYRPAPKLPTLSEDEVFRQQMAEEWMHKVAEREERRQHKIIKISKIEDEQQHATEQQANISDEFLNRVKERRHKLAMPADSDWESGAESQPVAGRPTGSESEADVDVETAPVRILEGQAEANLRELPRHLREFAKFSSREQLDGGEGHVERHEQQERSETATENAQSSASKKTTVVKTYKVSRLPPSVQDNDNTATNNNNNNENTNSCSSSSHNYNNSNKNHCTTERTSTMSSHIENESRSKSSLGRASPASPSPSPFMGNFHRNFDELFASSPFRSKIFEEFDKYWRNFEHKTTSDRF